jgi:hypothetical protein
LEVCLSSLSLIFSQKVLQTKNVNLIKRTVLRIPLRVVIPLLQEVTAAVESEPGKTAHSVAVCDCNGAHFAVFLSPFVCGVLLILCALVPLCGKY